MVLALPALALAVEGDLPVQSHPGHVNAQEPLPHAVALRRGHLRVGVDLVLEVIHHGAVGNEGQGGSQVAVKELAGIRAEEALGPGPGEELHAHGVDLAGLHAGPDALQRDALAVEPALEGVARLVGDHLHVVLGAVEVCEDKGDLIVRDAGAVAAGALALGGEDIQQLPVQHGPEELLRLGGELAVELHALGQDLIRGAHGPGIAGAELQRVVRETHGIGLSQPLRLAAVDAVRHRDEVLYDGGAELLHVVFSVAVAAHAVVAQGGVALVAQLSAHLVPELHQLVVEAVQLGLVVFVPLALGLPGGEAPGVVGVGLEGAQLGEGVDPALKGDLGGGQNLFIGLGQLVLLLQLGDDGGREGLELHLRVGEQDLAVLLGELLPEGARQHGLRPLLLNGLQLREEVVPELLLGVVVGVPGVDGVADAGQGGRRVDVAALRLLGEEDLPGLLIVAGQAQPLRQPGQGGLHHLRLRTGIDHLGKLHCDLPPACPPEAVDCPRPA